MGRFRIGIGLLAVLLALALGAQLGMNALRRPVEQALEQAMTAAEAEDFPQAAACVARAWESWSAARTLCAALADHSFMEDIEANLSMLSVWAQEQERADFRALCAETLLRVKAVADAHKLDLSTFF